MQPWWLVRTAGLFPIDHRRVPVALVPVSRPQSSVGIDGFDLLVGDLILVNKVHYGIAAPVNTKDHRRHAIGSRRVVSVPLPATAELDYIRSASQFAGRQRWPTINNNSINGPVPKAALAYTSTDGAGLHASVRGEKIDGKTHRYSTTTRCRAFVKAPLNSGS